MVIQNYVMFRILQVKLGDSYIKLYEGYVMLGLKKSYVMALTKIIYRRIKVLNQRSYNINNSK